MYSLYYYYRSSGSKFIVFNIQTEPWQGWRKCIFWRGEVKFPQFCLYLDVLYKEAKFRSNCQNFPPNAKISQEGATQLINFSTHVYWRKTLLCLMYSQRAYQHKIVSNHHNVLYQIQGHTKQLPPSVFITLTAASFKLSIQRKFWIASLF